MTTIHVGGVFSDDMTPVFYAQKAGLFRKAGLDVQIVPSTSGAAMTAAVLSGTYEFGKSSMLAAINAYLKNLPLAVIGAGAQYDSRIPYAELCVATDSAVTDGKGLDAKVLGTPSLNDLNQLVIDAWADRHGGDAKSLKFVELPQSATGVAVGQHRIDAAIMLQPVASEALGTHQVKSIGHPYDALGNDFIFATYFTSVSYAKAHPDVVAKFMKVIYEASAYTNKHHAETAAIMADVVKLPRATLEAMPRVDGATSLNPAQFQPVIDAAAKYHMIARAFPAREMLVNAPALK